MNSIYHHIGSKIRERRRVFGKTMQSLASELNISYQQLQKYERGVNQISLEKLLRIAELLQTNFIYFLPPNEASQLYKSIGMAMPILVDQSIDFELLALLKSLSSIKNDRVKAACVNLLKAHAKRKDHMDISKTNNEAKTD